MVELNWVSVITNFAIGIVGAAITIFWNNYCNRKCARVIPAVSIWDNKVDNIDEKLECDSYRWYVPLDCVTKLSKEHYYYLIIQSSSNFKIFNCRVNLLNSKEGYPKNVGTISNKRIAVIPILVDKKTHTIVLNIYYETEYGERMKYTLKNVIDETNGQLKERDDRVLLECFKITLPTRPIYENGYRQIKKLNMNLVDSFSSKEIKLKLGKDGTLNFGKKIIIKEE